VRHNWRDGTLTLENTKSGEASVLPLPPKVGRAIALYLRHGRPHGVHTDRIFVRHLIPIGLPLTSHTVSTAMKEAFKRAGMTVVSPGAHTLRHTAASRMVGRGVSLKQVAGLMRHRTIDSTAIYVNIDVARGKRPRGA
jgi:integrase